MGTKLEEFANCKVAFLDFDRTLCAHDYIRPVGKCSSKDESYKDVYKLYLDELARQSEIHEKDKPLPCMQWFVKLARRDCTSLVCLSHTTTNLRDGYNKNFLHRYYGKEIEYITVSSPDRKVPMMMAYCASKGIPLDRCAIVEDRMDTLEQAAAEGFLCIHISDVVCWYEEFVYKLQQFSFP